MPPVMIRAIVVVMVIAPRGADPDIKARPLDVNSLSPGRHRRRQAAGEPAELGAAAEATSARYHDAAAPDRQEGRENVG